MVLSDPFLRRGLCRFFEVMNGFLLISCIKIIHSLKKTVKIRSQLRFFCRVRKSTEMSDLCGFSAYFPELSQRETAGKYIF